MLAIFTRACVTVLSDYASRTRQLDLLGNASHFEQWCHGREFTSQQIPGGDISARMSMAAAIDPASTHDGNTTQQTCKFTQNVPLASCTIVFRKSRCRCLVIVG